MFYTWYKVHGCPLSRRPAAALLLRWMVASRPDTGVSAARSFIRTDGMRRAEGRPAAVSKCMAVLVSRAQAAPAIGFNTSAGVQNNQRNGTLEDYEEIKFLRASHARPTCSHPARV